MFAVTWQFSNCNKNTLGHEQDMHERPKRTCRTVTGTLTPLSSYMLVIPRFRAMRPVRIEFGVHFGAASAVGVANFATVELKCLTLVDGGRLRSRNMRGGAGKQEGVSKNASDLVGTRLRRTLAEDGHVRARTQFRCKEPSCKCCFTHLAWRI